MQPSHFLITCSHESHILLLTTTTMAVSYFPWFAFSSLMRSNEDVMVAKLKESFAECQNTYPHQLTPWSSQVLSEEHPIGFIGWWRINFQDHYILRYMLSHPEQKFLFVQVKSMLSCHESDKKKLLLVNTQQQCCLSEEYINTYILRVTDALLRVQDKYIYLTSIDHESTTVVCSNQEPARELSQDRKHYGIQLPNNPFRSFFSGKSFRKMSLRFRALNIQ